MADVFISYSRKDKDFVRRLHESLTAHERDTWIDWQDIEYAEDWWQKISTGIESADHFVFVITPDSVRSKVCFDEIQHAVSRNKRLIPILRAEITEEPDKQRMHPAIARHNWLPFQEGRDFEHAVTELLATVAAEPEHVKAHTRLLVRALEWDNRGRRPSLLLRGDDLRTAEAWLTAGVNKEPPPTDLHAQYIAASRRAARGTMRTVLAGVTVALIVAIGLSILSFMLFQQSEARRLEANLNLARSESLRLAAEANALLQTDGGNAETAALLSVRALNIHYSAQAVDALAQAAGRLSARKLALTGEQIQWNAAISPDGRLAVTAGGTGSDAYTVVLWDMQTGAVVRTFGDFTHEVYDVAFSPDGQMVAATSCSQRGGTDCAQGTITLFDANTGQPIHSWIAHTNYIYSIAFSPDGRYILSGAGGSDEATDNTARLWEVASGEPRLVLTGHMERLTSVAFSPDGQMALTASEDGTARLWSLDTGEEIRQFTGHLSGINSANFSPDGRSIITASRDRTVRLWDVETGNETRRFTRHTDIVWDADFSPDGRYAASGSLDNTARVWDIATGEVLYTFTGSSYDIGGLAFSPDGRSLLTWGNGGGPAWVWDISGDGEDKASSGEIRQFSDIEGNIRYAAFSPDGVYVLTGGFGGLAQLWDATSGEEIRRFAGHPSYVSSVAFSPDGRYALTSSSSTAFLWDVSTGEQIRAFRGHTDTVVAVAFSPDGRTILTASIDWSARLWDTASGNQILVLARYNQSANAGAFSHDGRFVITGSSDHTARVWDAASGTLVHVLEGSGAISAVAFSADDRFIYTDGDGNVMQVWDAASGHLVRNTPGPALDGPEIAFSPDGRYVASGGDDNSVRLWDALTGGELRRYTGHSVQVTSVAFSPDGRTILSASIDGTARLWEATPYPDIIRAVCERIVRDLTPDEREIYLIEDTTPTCPRADA